MDAKQSVVNERKVAGAAKRLGRGLGALIPIARQDAGATAIANAAVATPPSVDVSRGTAAIGSEHQAAKCEATDGPRPLPVDAITPNRHQPRDTFSEESIAELAESIRKAGVLQPILVRPAPSSDGREGYELIAGERRWRAVKRLGLPTIPAIVRSATDLEAAEFALVENLQRDDLNPVERAFALRSLAETFGLSHQQIAEAVGLDRPTISNLIRLTELDRRSLDLVRIGKLSAGHARALLGIRDTATRSLLADTAVMEEWSVRTLEREVQRTVDRAANSKVSRGTQPTAVRSAHISGLEDKLSRALGTRVHLQLGRKKGTGRMTIEFFSLEQFDGILATLGVDGANA